MSGFWRYICFQAAQGRPGHTQEEAAAAPERGFGGDGRQDRGGDGDQEHQQERPFWHRRQDSEQKG